jgi:hypothetical protein
VKNDALRAHLQQQRLPPTALRVTTGPGMIIETGTDMIVIQALDTSELIAALVATKLIIPQ